MTRSTLPLLTLLSVLSAAATSQCAPSAQLQDVGQQLVFGGSDPASSAPSRQPDFIDRLQAEAEAKGIKLDLGLDHLAQKAQEEAHRASLAAEKQPHADELLKAFSAVDGGKVEEWSSLILPDGDVEEIEDIKEAASHAAEMYAAKHGSADTGEIDLGALIGHIKISKSDKVSTKGEPGSGWVWQSCALENEAVNVDSIDVTPDPPKPGKNMTVHGKGVVKSLVDVRTRSLASQFAISHTRTPSFTFRREATSMSSSSLG